MNAPWFGAGADRYDSAIAAMLPGGEPHDVRVLRRRLLTSRDLASQALGNARQYSDEVASLYRLILHVASTYCFCPVRDDLHDAANLCVRLFTSASALERLEGHHDRH